MASKKTTTHNAKTRAKEVASGGTAVRDRVRELSVRAMRDRELSLGALSKLVHEVLEGAVEGVDSSIPQSKRNVLREVFDGLSEGIHAMASAGSAVASDVRDRGEAIGGKSAPAAAKRIRAANEEFLGAVKSFAGKASKEVREELDALVTHAERTGPKVASATRKATEAADGRLLELSGETARAGVKIVRRAAGTLAMGAGGLLEGLAEVITPKSRPASAKPAKSTAARTASKKKTAKKITKKKTRKG
jgi:hypothetical protein